MSDIADRYARLADGFLARVRATPDALWDAPSPCRGWTARDVVAHVVNGHRGIVAVARGTRPAAADCVGLSAMGDAPAVDPGADLAAAFTRCRDDLLTVLRDPVLASRPLPFGPLAPVSVEQAVDLVGGPRTARHTWDVARATRGDEVLDTEAVARTHRGLQAHSAALQVTGAFDRSVPAPDGADAQTAFLCFTGRRP